MGYTVPLRFIKISHKRNDNRQFDVSICATRIVAIMSTEISQARKVISDERKNGTLINGCGLAKAKSAIFLDNGSIVSSPLTVRRLMALIEKSNNKANSRLDKRLRVFDVYDEEPTEDDEITNDASGFYDKKEDQSEIDELEEEYDEY